MDSLRTLITDTDYRDYRIMMTDEPSEILNLRTIAMQVVRAYPPELRDRGIELAATYFLVVDTVGVPVQTRLVRSTGDFDLDESAARLVTQLRFTPALVAGCRVPAATIIPLSWTTG